MCADIKKEILRKTIIDFKPISPQHGDLFQNRDPVTIARALEKAGVLGLSVVTQSKHFGGSLALLRSIAEAVDLPILRKDFIQTEEDLYETLDCGAKGVLLICATIKDLHQVERLHQKAIEIGLNPLVEVHTEEEMQMAKSIHAKRIGINNKDITALEKDGGSVARTLELIRLAPPDAFLVSESGIRGYEDARAALDGGAHAVLVGTAFWQGDFEIL